MLEPLPLQIISKDEFRKPVVVFDWCLNQASEPPSSFEASFAAKSAKTFGTLVKYIILVLFKRT